MIPHGVEVFVAIEPVDMRLGFDRLAGLAEERMQRSARSGALFLFFGKSKTALKLLFFDGSGLCVFHKRLDRRCFCIPEALDDSAVLVLEERALDDLLEGIDIKREQRPRPPRKPRPRTH
jgi:transposase